jgi:hypothetical protein
VDRNPSGLVDHEKRRILEDDGKRSRLRLRFGTRVGNPHRRNPDAVSRTEPIVGLHPPAVDSHFPASEHPIYVALRDAFQPAQQEIIDALALGFLADFEYRGASLV